MTYNTGNPIGSTDARDRSDNSENLDLAVNSLSQTFVDRLGRTRDTLEGIYQKSAYYRVGTFDAGYTLTNNRQTLAYGNVEYSWSGTFPKVVPAGSTPATSGGIGAGGWVDRSDVTLRAEISNADGLKLLGSCPTIATLRTTEPTTDGQQISVSGYYTAMDGSGGIFWYDSTDTTSADNGGTVIVTTGLNRWKRRLDVNEVTTKQFGCKADGTTVDDTALQNFFDYVGSSGCTGVISSGTHKITSAMTCTSTKSLIFRSEPDAKIWVYAAVQALTITTTKLCSVYGLTVNPRVNSASGIRFNNCAMLTTRGIDVSSPNTTDATGFVNGLQYHNCSFTKTYDFWDMATSGNALVITSDGQYAVSHDIFAPNIFGANTGILVDIAGAVAAGIEGVRVFGGEIVTNTFGVYITNSTAYTPPLFKFSGCHISSNVSIHADHVTHVVLSACNMYCKIKWLDLVSCGECSIIGGEFVCIGAGGTSPISLESTTSIDITGLYAGYPTANHLIALYGTATQIRLRSSTYNVNNWTKNVANGDIYVTGVPPAVNSLFRDNFPVCPVDSTYNYVISANSVVLTDRGEVYNIVNTGIINNFTGNRNRAVTIALPPGVTLTHGSGLTIIGYANYITTAAATYCVFIPNQDSTGWIEISRRT